jgi:hypothetical protein
MTTLKGARVVGACLTAGLLAAAWLASTTPAVATTLRRIDLTELVGRADRIVHARAVDLNVHWNAAGTQILTDTTFEILDQAKGQGPARLTVTMLGGRIDPVEMSAEGTPVFRAGEEVVLFTSPRPDGAKNLVGFSQGVMRIVEDPETGEKTAISEVPVGVTYMQMVEGKPAVVHPSRRHAPLSALLDEIRRIVEESRSGPARSPTGRGALVSPTPRRVDGGRP